MLRLKSFVAICLVSIMLTACLGSKEEPTPSQTQLGSIKLSASISPTAQADRRSSDPFVIEIRVENLGEEQRTVDISATSTEDFRFFALEGEPNQQVNDSGHKISQTDIILAPQLDQQSSYKVIYFGFVQTEQVVVGTHNFVIQADLPNDDPIRMSVLFEVLGGYVLFTPEPTVSSTPASSP